MSTYNTNDDVILIKIGGSSITDKSTPEKLKSDAIKWLVHTIKHSIRDRQGGRRKRYIIVHGAGSFGHHTAKEYGLKGIKAYPPSQTSNDENFLFRTKSDVDCRHKLLGLGRTRVLVQKLNQIIVTAFLEHDIPAVAISPCFSIVQQLSSGDIDFYSPEQQQDNLRSIVQSTLDAGLIPILHGDAGLFNVIDEGSNCSQLVPAIISGDTIMQMIGTAKFVSHVIFITDVDGVFTTDPRIDPNAQLIPKLYVDTSTSAIISSNDSLQFDASESSHVHDVTGGLKVSF
jgi:isopentenyl phosphate kinase